MISTLSGTGSDSRQRHTILFAILTANLLGVLYFAFFFYENGYLPEPFIFDKSDTFMDMFNPMYWAFDAGRYTEWRSTYPPLNFLLLRLWNAVFSDAGVMEPHALREVSSAAIVGFCMLYLVLPLYMQRTTAWRVFSGSEKALIYLTLVLSSPMLFALERGNLVLLCPALLGLALSKTGHGRALSLALLMNLKPYFGLLLLYYFARKNWRGLVTCVVISGWIFLATGLLLDEHFYLIFFNLLGFSQSSAVFSPREVMALPSSVSAFSYVLNNANGARFAEGFIPFLDLHSVTLLVEATKWGALVVAFWMALFRSQRMRDGELMALLIVMISNSGVSVGGYTYILYSALLPVFWGMRYWKGYCIVLAAIALPLDIVPLISTYFGPQYVFLSDRFVDVYWSVGLGSLLRPTLNIGLLAALSFEFMQRNRGSNCRAESRELPMNCFFRARSSICRSFILCVHR